MTDKAILIGREIKIIEDVLVWGKWFEENFFKRQVARTELGGDSFVSTVFLGFNHNFGGVKDLWFETMVFRGPFDGKMMRYETWAEAEAGHAEIVKIVKPTWRNLWHLMKRI